jgi:hypothetical protein
MTEDKVQKVRTTIELDKELKDWHEETFPPGTLWRTINGLLKHYKDLYTGKPPANYLKLGAQAMKEQLDGDLSTGREL